MSNPIARRRGGFVGIAAAALAAFILPCAAADAAQITYGFRGNDAAIMITGEIEPGDAMAVSRTMGAVGATGHRLAVVALNSPGGRVSEATIISDMVRTQGLSTFIPNNGECASACFMIFAAGRGKVVGDGVMVGIHSAAETVMVKGPFDARETSVPTMTANSQVITAEVVNYVQTLGVPRYLTTKMAQTPANQIYWLNNDDLQAMGAAFSH